MFTRSFAIALTVLVAGLGAALAPNVALAQYPKPREEQKSGLKFFNGKRGGFLLGLGLGGSFQTYRVETVFAGQEPTRSSRQYAAGFATDLRIGAGIGDKFQLYYDNRVSWFSGTDLADSTETGRLTVFGISAIGASYYFRTQAPSSYILASAGVSAWSNPNESDSQFLRGVGISIGAGYEFKKHFSAEGTINWGYPQDTFDPTPWIGTGETNRVVRINSLALMVTIVGTAY
jgi:hypothetical protein